METVGTAVEVGDLAHVVDAEDAHEEPGQPQAKAAVGRGLIWTLVFVALAIVWLVWYSNLSDDRKEELRQERKARATAKLEAKSQTGEVGFREPISSASHRPGNTAGACPRCGGTQFTAKRSIKGKVMVGVLAPKTQVKCEPFGAMYKGG